MAASLTIRIGCDEIVEANIIDRLVSTPLTTGQVKFYIKEQSADTTIAVVDLTATLEYPGLWRGILSAATTESLIPNRRYRCQLTIETDQGRKYLAEVDGMAVINRLELTT